MRTYPFNIAPDAKKLADAVNLIAKTRQDDISEWDNLPNVFIRGRKVGKTPSGSSDIAASDKDGDFNYDGSYLYLCLGSAWRRVALSTW